MPRDAGGKGEKAAWKQDLTGWPYLSQKSDSHKLPEGNQSTYFVY